MYKLYRLLFALSCCHAISPMSHSEIELHKQLISMEIDCKGDSDCLEKIDNLRIAISSYVISMRPMVINGNVTYHQKPPYEPSISRYDEIPYKRK